MNDFVYRNYTAKEIEAQLNPRAAVPDRETTIAESRERSAAWRAVARNASYDVAYGPHRLETMDIFRPESPAGAPMHVYIHGGYWRSRDKADFGYLAPALIEAGAIVCCVNYGLCPEVTIDEIVRQVRSCCAFLWRHPDVYGGDRNRIHIAGHSAGGHLAAMAAATDWPAFAEDLPRNLVKSALMMSGIYDLAPVMHVSVQQEVRLTEEMASRNSPLFMRPATDAPLAVVAGGAETDEFRRQSKALAEAWEKHAPLEYYELPELNHYTVLLRTANPESRLTWTKLRLMGLA